MAVLQEMRSQEKGVRKVGNISLAATFVGEAAILLGVLMPVIVWVKKIGAGTRCQL